MRIAVIWNGRAGSAAESDREDLVRRLAHGDPGAVEVFEVSETTSPAACARAALARGAGVVVAAGGDGTVSAVAAELLGSPAQLGVLPVGTANSFAAALGIPGDPVAAAALIDAGPQRVIDAGMVESVAGRRAMILHCMVGLHADTIAATSTDAKRRWGVLAYAGSALRELSNLSPFDVEMVTSEHTIRCRAIAVAVANLAPLKSVLAHGPSHLLGDDGCVDVTIVSAETIAEAIATGIHLYRTAREGEPATRDNVGSFSTARVAITADPGQRVVVDGEPFGETPVTIEALPRALTVIAPPPPPAEGPILEAPLAGLPALEVDGTARS